MTPEEIRSLIAHGEGQRLEFKRSLAELETGTRAVAAMTNMDGGHVLFGVRDNGTVLGVDIGVQTKERIVRTVTDNTDPAVYPSVEYVELDGKIVILVTVTESVDKPHLIRGRAYKRVGAADVQMNRAEYERLLRDRPGAEYDGQVIAQATLDDIDWAKVERYLASREQVTVAGSLSRRDKFYKPGAAWLKWKELCDRRWLVCYSSGSILKPSSLAAISPWYAFGDRTRPMAITTGET